MRVNKLKYAKKTLTFYRNYFGFIPPYRLLIDGTFCKAALDAKVNIKDHLATYLAEETEVFSTPCARKECKLFGAILSGPLQLLRRFAEYPCHHDPPISAVNCLLSLTSQRNKEKFILASQDPGLLEKGRDRVGVPLILVSHNSIHLEKPSVKTTRAANRELGKKLQLADYQQDSLIALKRTVLGEQEESRTEVKKRRRKGRNPLSCKPALKRTHDETQEGVKGRRRKRRYRLKVAPHIRAPLRDLVREIRAQN